MLSWTLGWSNGLTPSLWPASAAATSQRKNSAHQVERLGQDQIDQRVAGVDECLQLGAVLEDGLIGRPKPDEDTVIAEDLGAAEWLARDGDNAPAFLAGALGNQVLDPEAERLERRRGDKRHLVRPPPGQRAGARPSTAPGFSRIGFSGRHALTATSARSSSAVTFRPIRAAGTMPKYDRTE